MRIIVTPDALREGSRQLQATAEQLENIQSSLERSLQSIEWEASIKTAVEQKWQQAAWLSAQIHTLLHELSKQLQSKADQFQTADQQAHPILGQAYQIGSAASLYSTIGIGGASLIIPAAGTQVGAISNPSAVVRAIATQEDKGSRWNWKPTAPEMYGYGKDGYRMINMARSGFNVNVRGDGYATISGARSKFALSEGIQGTRYAASNAANHTNVWKFVDPVVAAKESLSIKGWSAKLGYAGLAYDTGTAVMTDYDKGGPSRAAASAAVNGSIGVGTMAASAAVGAWVGSVVPVAGTVVGAGVGLAAGAAISMVTEVRINGKSIKTHAVDAVDTVVDTVTDTVSSGTKAAADTVQDGVKAVKSGATKAASKVVSKVTNMLGGVSVGKLLPG